MIAAEQARAFLAMALCGALCAAVHDGMMLLRRLMGVGRVMGGALDLAYGAVPAAAMTAAGLRLRIAPFRLYAFAGVALGMLLWFMTLGRLFRYLFGLWTEIWRKIVQENAKKAGKAK